MPDVSIFAKLMGDKSLMRLLHRSAADVNWEIRLLIFVSNVRQKSNEELSGWLQEVVRPAQLPGGSVGCGVGFGVGAGVGGRVG